MPRSRTLIIPLLQVRAQEHDAAVKLGEELQRDHLRAVPPVTPGTTDLQG